jgi:hypothetical protein
LFIPRFLVDQDYPASVEKSTIKMSGADRHFREGFSLPAKPKPEPKQSDGAM